MEVTLVLLRRRIPGTRVMRCSVRELPLALLRADDDARHDDARHLIRHPTAALDVPLDAADVTFYNLTWAIFLARRVRAPGRPMLAEYTVLDIFVGEAQLPEIADGGDDAHDDGRSVRGQSGSLS